MNHFSRRPAFTTYSPPGVDSPRAIAGAKSELCGRKMNDRLDGIDVEAFARRNRVRVETAVRLIEEVRRGLAS